MAKDAEEKLGNQASKARRGIVIVNYMVRGRPDMAVAARVLSKMMASPVEGIELCRHLASRPRAVLMSSFYGRGAQTSSRLGMLLPGSQTVEGTSSALGQPFAIVVRLWRTWRDPRRKPS